MHNPRCRIIFVPGKKRSGRNVRIIIFVPVFSVIIVPAMASSGVCLTLVSFQSTPDHGGCCFVFVDREIPHCSLRKRKKKNSQAVGVFSA